MVRARFRYESLLETFLGASFLDRGNRVIVGMQPITGEVDDVIAAIAAVDIVKMRASGFQIGELLRPFGTPAEIARRCHRRTGELDADRTLAGRLVVALERIARQIEGPRAVHI